MIKKEYKTLEEKIDILKNDRKLNFVDENRFVYFLDKYGYQTIVNGYNDFLFVSNRSSNYLSCANEQNLISLFLFDRELSALLFRNISEIEMRLKASIAEEICVFGKKMGKDNEINFGRILKTSTNDWKKFFPKAFGGGSIFLKEYNEKSGPFNKFVEGRLKMLLSKFIPVNKNYKLLEKYENDLDETPIWTLSIFFSFGDAVKLLRVLNPKIQRNIVKRFSDVNIGVQIFIEVMELFKNLRNRICHENVIYNSDFELNLNRYLKSTSFFEQQDININTIRMMDILKLICLFKEDSSLIDDFNVLLNRYLGDQNFDNFIKQKIFAFIHFQKK